MGAVAWDNFLYVLGGSPNAQSGYADVYVAPIHANGTIGSWTSTTALPSQRYALTAAAYGGYLYAIAGTPSPQSGLAQVLYASINANGTIGSWNTTSALPSGRYFHSSAVYNGHLYVMGGLTNGYFSDTLVALINDDGTLESWTATSSLPAVRAAHTSVLSDGFIYTLGGYSGGYLSSVIMANVSAGSDDSPYAPLLRGIYSRVFDVQADSSTLSVLINGWYQRGANIRLEVRVAPGSTGIFGSRIVFDAAIVGSPITLAPTGRWVWVRLILDDTASEDVAEPAYVTDLTVSPFPPPLPPLPPSPPPPEEPPPDPAAPVPSITPEYPEPKDTILPCSAGASANPMGILAMGLLVLAGAIWRQTRRAIPS